MATKLKITYADGREVKILASPKAQVMTERRYEGLNDESRMVETSYYLAWQSLFWAGQESADFEAWLDLVADVEEIKPQKGATDQPRPTQQAQSTISSSD
jgi:hypothetical protein